MSNSPRPQYFNPRPPRGGRRNTGDRGLGGGYFNPRPPRGGRPAGAVGWRTSCQISIHALREEGDIAKRKAEGEALLFQSTPSARRATPVFEHRRSQLLDFNPRPPRGERLTAQQVQQMLSFISIHALREESDREGCKSAFAQSDFNPRPPRGERPARRNRRHRAHDFNPRPPRGERR